ncbi:MAG TPA: maleylpyruvate isomerase N-terminal domain-containing protein, partial [Kineosporiaceae bacterium]|nr:maleylpyruvate isomerase N-terminal domain-containing protein [Kineosporiaceae bacterium]
MTTTNSASGEASAPVEPTAASPDAPFFPAPVLPELADPASARELIAGTLQALAEVVDVPGDAAGRPTPCEQYTVRELRDHVLGWLQFFAAAFADPDATAARPDPESYHVADSGARE